MSDQSGYTHTFTENLEIIGQTGVYGPEIRTAVAEAIDQSISHLDEKIDQIRDEVENDSVRMGVTQVPRSGDEFRLIISNAQPTVIGDAKVLIVSATVNSLPVTFIDDEIEEDMVVLKSEVGSPLVQNGDLTVTTGDGNLTIEGSISGSTDISIYLLGSKQASIQT